MTKLSNRILTAEERAEQDAEFAEHHFDFPDGSEAQPSTDLKSTTALTSPDAAKLSVERATCDDTTITKRSRQEYVAAFRSDLRNTAQSILEMCRTAYEAKKTLGHFEFEDFCNEIGHRAGSSTIRKYVVIGKVYPRLIEHADKLPVSWTSMYLITQIPNEDFERLIGVDDGRLANLTGAELNAMVRSTRQNDDHALRSKITRTEAGLSTC